MSTTNPITTTAIVQPPRGYAGINCQCKTCSKLSPEERTAKFFKVADGRRRGGLTRAAQPSMREARQAGFWRTMELHPFFARHYLKGIIRDQNRRRQRIISARVLIVGQAPGCRQPMAKGASS